jgi:hypothetical protein
MSWDVAAAPGTGAFELNRRLGQEIQAPANPVLLNANLTL